MKGLKERVKDREEEFKRIIQAEKLTEPTIQILQKVKGSLSGSIYPTSAFLYLSTPSIEELEDKYLPNISSALKCKWSRVVEKDVIRYTTNIHIIRPQGLGMFYIYISVEASPTKSCKIISIPTGKMREVEKKVIVEEPEVEYFIDCGGGENE